MFQRLIAHPVWTAIGAVATVLALFAAGFEWITCIPETERFKVCRDPAHGVEQYQYSESVSDQSGWRGGGYSQPAFCSELMRRKEAAIGQSIVWGTPQSSEDSRRVGLGRVEYNYVCTISAQWAPVYRAARSEICGQVDGISKSNVVMDVCTPNGKIIGFSLLGFRWIGWPW